MGCDIMVNGPIHSSRLTYKLLANYVKGGVKGELPLSQVKIRPTLHPRENRTSPLPYLKENKKNFGLLIPKSCHFFLFKKIFLRSFPLTTKYFLFR